MATDNELDRDKWLSISSYNDEASGTKSIDIDHDESDQLVIYNTKTRETNINTLVTFNTNNQANLLFDIMIKEGVFAC